MNDKTLFENYLLILKSTVEVYVHGTLESSNSDIRNVLKGNLSSTMTYQADTYDLMKENGWYQVNNISKNDANILLNKIESAN